jgi:diadenosine tetraphosphate (Ap4A) HIT family hydrolase
MGEGCLACDLATGRVALPGGLIHRTRLWLVEHCIGPLGVGTLVVKPRRHVTEVAELSDGEVAELGPLLRMASAITRDLTDADQVYNCLWSHSGGTPVHIHYIIQPVTRAQMDEHGVYGPELQMALFRLGDLPDPGLVELFADTARARFVATSQA